MQNLLVIVCLILTALISVATVAWIHQADSVFELCIVLIAADLAFLCFNLRMFGRSRAKIFLGDTGSTFIGFSICWLIIYASQAEHKILAPASVLWIIALPLVDSVCIMVRRLRKGRSPFAPDREHLHHILSLAGFSVNRTLILVSLAALLISVTGIVLAMYLGIADSMVFAGFLLIFALHYLSMNHAWVLMKTIRYLRTNKSDNERYKDRRRQERRTSSQAYQTDILITGSAERRTLADRRNIPDRRFTPNSRQLAKTARRLKLF